MFTVVSSTRKANLYLIAVLAILAVVLLVVAIIPAISAPKRAMIPVTGVSEIGSDYFQRHPELRVPGAGLNDDFALRHAVWAASAQGAAIPVTGAAEASNYFQRHPEIRRPAASSLDTSDYFTRHPDLRH